MTFKALAGALVVASLVALSAFATPVPGWFMAGSHPNDYEMGIVPGSGQNRGPAAFLKSKKDGIAGFGTMMQQFAADDYREKRVRFSAAVRTEEVKSWAGLWMRVDGVNGRVLAFDNMQKRPIPGNTGWQRYDVVLDVPAEAQVVAFGVLMGDSGKLWIEDAKFEAVGTSVPVTGTAKAADAMAKGPRNLGFQP